MQGKVALVTGSARGLGKASALTLALEGATVVINDIQGNREMATATVNDMQKGGLSAELALGDVSDEAQVDEMVAGIISRHGRLDVLNASMLIMRQAQARCRLGHR